MGRVSLANTHPFIAPDGRLALAHNGHVGGNIPYDEKTYAPEGQTDSERVMFHYLTGLDDGLDIDAAMKTVMQLRGRTNIVTIQRDGLVAVMASEALHAYDGDGYVLYASQPVECEALGITPSDELWRELPWATVEQIKDGEILSSNVVAQRATAQFGRHPQGRFHERNETLGNTDWWARDYRPFTERVAECEFCDQAFLSQTRLRQHLAEEHQADASAETAGEEDGYFICEYCEARVADPRAFRRHLALHLGETEGSPRRRPSNKKPGSQKPKKPKKAKKPKKPDGKANDLESYIYG